MKKLEFESQMQSIMIEMQTRLGGPLSDSEAYDVALSLKETHPDVWNYAAARAGADELDVINYLINFL